MATNRNIPAGMRPKVDSTSGRSAVDGSTPQIAATLDGITLEKILNRLVIHYGWEELGRRIAIACFTTTPSVRSSLTFLRKTPWARQKVEQLFLQLPPG